MESSLNKELDGLQSELDHKFDNLECSISKFSSQQHAHQEGENSEGGCLTDTMVEEQCQQQGLYLCCCLSMEKEEEIPPLLIEEAVEEHQDHNLPLPSIDSVYILPTSAAHSNLETPTIKATTSALPVLQNIRKLVATVRAFATTSKTLATAHTTWHSGWFGC